MGSARTGRPTNASRARPPSERRKSAREIGVGIISRKSEFGPNHNRPALELFFSRWLKAVRYVDGPRIHFDSGNAIRVQLHQLVVQFLGRALTLVTLLTVDEQVGDAPAPIHCGERNKIPAGDAVTLDGHRRNGPKSGRDFAHPP